MDRLSAALSSLSALPSSPLPQQTEMKDVSHDMSEQVVKTAEKIYHTACDACHNVSAKRASERDDRASCKGTSADCRCSVLLSSLLQWRHYPKLLTTMVLLLSFLLGAGSMGLVSKTGLMGRGGSVSHQLETKGTPSSQLASDALAHSLSCFLSLAVHLVALGSQHGGCASRARRHFGSFEGQRACGPSSQVAEAAGCRLPHTR